MEIFKFKTDIYSIESQAGITPLLNEDAKIAHWHINSDDQTLTVSGNELDPEHVKKLVAQAGFQAKLIEVFGVSGSSL
ncbi:copper chaperone [Xanthocytophaga agilis]|uniref:Copper chaperone n=1 Tax=Xanthocytophaga agilis TaxID=3048010 RepID=A0AAE3RDT6_9BACT|nr:copper chaperone [Xanthocytophaga agilis]MDJ1506152.1 copper chaperone [Xanthocytophaga agilis]